MSDRNLPSWNDPTDREIERAAGVILAHRRAVPEADLARIFPGRSRACWVGSSGDLDEPRLASLLEYWQRQRPEGGGMPPRRAMDPLEMKPLLGFLMVLELERDGFDAIYRLYGSNLAGNGAGRDWTGFRVSEMCRQMQAPAALLARACYLAIHRRPAPFFTMHTPPRRQGVGVWKRLMLPLADSDGACTRILVASLPLEQRDLSEAERQAYEDWVRRTK